MRADDPEKQTHGSHHRKKPIYHRNSGQNQSPHIIKDTAKNGAMGICVFRLIFPRIRGTAYQRPAMT